MKMIYTNYLDSFPVAWALHIKEIGNDYIKYDIRADDEQRTYLGEMVFQEEYAPYRPEYAITLEGDKRIIHEDTFIEASKSIDQELNPSNWKKDDDDDEEENE